MKIKGSIINGLFPYIKGIDYTKGDLVWYTEIYRIYVVTGDYNGVVTPDESDVCVDFFKFHEWSKHNNDDSAIITARVLESIIKTYVNGLKGNGELEKIRIRHVAQLDRITSTSAYDCVVTNDSIMDVPGGRYLLNVYKTSDTTIQELIDYNDGVIIYRCLDGNGFSNFRMIPSFTEYGVNREKWVNFMNKVTGISKRLNAFVEKAKKSLQKNQFTYSSIPQKSQYDTESQGYYRIPNTNQTIIDKVPSDKVINLIINYNKYDTPQQFNINTYITNNLGVTHKLFDLDGNELLIKLNYNQVDSKLTMIGSEFELNLVKVFIENDTVIS